MTGSEGPENLTGARKTKATHAALVAPHAASTSRGHFAPPSKAVLDAAGCRHCGNPLSPDQRESGFCCTGCSFVYRLIRDRGLEKYYDLRDAVIPPVKPDLLEARDYGWLTQRQAAAEADKQPGAPARDEVSIHGLSCVGCVWLIEKIFLKRDGALECEVNPQLGRVRLAWRTGACDLPAFARELQAFGYLLGPPGRSTSRASQGLLTRLGLCGAFTMNAMLFTLPSYLKMEPSFELARLFDQVTVLLAALSVGVGGSFFITKAVRGLREGVLEMDLPIALGIVLAFCGSVAGWLLGYPDLMYFDFVCLFTFLMLVGRWTQETALERNRNRLLDLNPQPREIRVHNADGTTSATPPEDLTPRTLYGLTSGQVAPVCGRLVDDEAAFSLAWITGEPEAQVFRRGRLVPAGARNLGQREVRLEAVEGWGDSFLNRLLSQAENATFRNALLERTLKLYLAVVIAVALCGGAVWLATTGSLLRAAQVTISVLVVSCPCALGVAIPLASERAVALLRRAGVFVRNGALWARVAKVRRVVFDKTGTLTLESPILKDRNALAPLSPDQRRALFLLVETNLHPVSRCLREALLEYADALEPSPGETSAPVDEEVGRGLYTRLGGAVWSLGRPGWVPETLARDTLPPDAGAEAEFRRNGTIVAHFHFAETVRNGAAVELAELERTGLPVYILSGDRAEKVNALARQLGLPAGRALAGLTPEQKADWLRTHAPADALMLGDGANDSLAFEQAICRGTPVVDRGLLEQKADFYFLGRDLRGIGALLSISRRRARAVRQIFTFAASYNALAVSLCLAGLMNPLVAAVVMPFSALTCVGLATWNLRASS